MIAGVGLKYKTYNSRSKTEPLYMDNTAWGHQGLVKDTKHIKVAHIQNSNIPTNKINKICADYEKEDRDSLATHEDATTNARSKWQSDSTETIELT